MDRAKMKLDDKAFNQKFDDIMSGEKKKRIGSTIFVIALLVFLIVGCAWSQGWFNFSSQSKPFDVKISNVSMEPVNGDIVIYAMVSGNGKEANIIPAEIKAVVSSYKAGTLMLRPEETNIDVISGKLDGTIEKGTHFSLSVKKGEYEIVPLLVYYNSNEERKEIVGKTRTYVWDETGFHEEE